MAQHQDSNVITDFAAFTEVDLEQYLGQNYVLHKNFDASKKLQQGTTSIIEVSFYLHKQKRVLKRKHYKELLVSLDLEGEDRKYVKVGAAFADFDPTALERQSSRRH